MTDNTQSKQPSMSMERIYVKDASYESPNAPKVFVEKMNPQTNVQVAVAHRELDGEPGFFEVILTVTVSANAGEKTIFLVEVQQAGVFHVQGISEQDQPKLLEIACPNVLLPFAREAISDFVSKGGFPQLLINPINFETLYLQKQATQEQQAQH